jgi:hypothetical protein
MMVRRCNNNNNNNKQEQQRKTPKLQKHKNNNKNDADRGEIGNDTLLNSCIIVSFKTFNMSLKTCFYHDAFAIFELMQ